MSLSPGPMMQPAIALSPPMGTMIAQQPPGQVFGVVPNTMSAAPPAPRLAFPPPPQQGYSSMQGNAAQNFFQSAKEMPKSRARETVMNQQGQVARLTTIGVPLNDKLEVYDASTGETQAGVGIFFQQEAASWIYVASVVPNSSADRCGLIRGDDELVQVDSVKVTSHESLADVRMLILGRPGSFVALSFRRAGGQYGNGPRGDYYYYDVELMRGSVDFIQMQQEAMLRPDYTQYELEIGRLRDEIDALRHQQDSVPDDPRVAPLEDELKARMDDLRRFEQMLVRSQERTKEAERAQAEARESLQRLKEENEKLVARETEHSRVYDDLQGRFATQSASLEQMKRQMLQEIEAERTLRSSVESQLSDVTNEIAKLQADANAAKGKHLDPRARLRQGHATIREALQAQEQQLGTLADVIPALDMVHSSLISSIALDPIRLQTYDFSLPKTPRFQGVNLTQPPPLSASIHSFRGAIDYAEVKIDQSALDRIHQNNKVQEDVA
eukprot:CAMPEP_0173379516 /NCGR_PEP_ID=MMETSP1356-20130122/2424_1 /TAXON_ID=77927 ORGANISM="Hemiselmis virescens, Strain PCC157" /NCGR_SAMPLE_ID=MMETSP1356 /ASSEMBLY_ACC=CAM_ASM_000847 /LENGTH=497 /DNA_ID=CAMNT_0014332861 /DNA_START=76 /DNA_END=1569 /DNA_ORIENTATION=+